MLKALNPWKKLISYVESSTCIAHTLVQVLEAH